MANVTSEHEAGDAIHVATAETAGEFERIQKDQGRLQVMTWTVRTMMWLWPQGSSPSVGQHTRPRVQNGVKAITEVCNSRATHEAICVEARKALHRTYDIQRKVSEIHRERTRRISNEHARAEGHVSDGIGSLGRAVQAAANATHSLTCGVPDRENDEVNCLREATELIDAWQHQLQGGRPMG